MVSKWSTVPKTKNYQDYHVFCKNSHGRVKVVFLIKEFGTVGSGITFSYIWMLKNLNPIFLYLSKFKNFRSKNSNVIKMKNPIWITKISPFFHLDRYFLFPFFFFQNFWRDFHHQNQGVWNYSAGACCQDGHATGWKWSVWIIHFCLKMKPCNLVQHYNSWIGCISAIKPLSLNL